MAINAGFCATFKQQLLEGCHDFRVGGDVFKLALYTEFANINVSTTAYTTTGEITATGYTAGGITLTQINPTVYLEAGVVSFANPSWTSSDIVARGGMIYNTTPAHTYTNPSCIILDFGMDRYPTNGIFTVTMPYVTNSTAIIRIM